VFNTGERVEAYTSALWIAALWLGDLLTPLRLEWVAVVLGIAGTVSGLALSTAGSMRLARLTVPGSFLAPAGAAVVAVLAPTWVFATSGLEGGLVFFWIGACAWVLARWATSDRRFPLWGAVVVGLGVLVRPELSLMTLAFAAAFFAGDWSTTGWRRRLALLGALLAIPLAYQIFRMGYFATLLPNTAYAKDASGSRWNLGVDYARDFANTYALWIPLVLLALGGYLPLVRRLFGQDRRAMLVVIAFLVAATLDALYITRIGGDYIPARLLLPAVFAFCAPVAVVAWRLRDAVALAVLPWAVVCALALRPSSPYYTTIGVTARNVVTLEDTGFTRGSSKLAWFRAPGIYYGQSRLDASPGPDAGPSTVFAGGIGIVGYALGTNVNIMDSLGLADPVTAHFTLTSRGRPGHEKPEPPPWVAARITAPGSNLPAKDFPNFTLIRLLLPPSTGKKFQEQVADARKSIDCGELRELRDSYRQHLTLGRFFENIGRSFRLSGVSIPPDPAKAVTKFCR
jgi:arabinofuranosyltransferase